MSTSEGKLGNCLASARLPAHPPTLRTCRLATREMCRANCRWPASRLPVVSRAPMSWDSVTADPATIEPSGLIVSACSSATCSVEISVPTLWPWLAAVGRPAQRETSWG